MNKFKLTSLIAAAALVSVSASPSMASSFPSSGVVTGVITFQQSMTIDCTFNAVANVVGNDVVLTGMTFSAPASPYCGTAVMPNSGPWVIENAALHSSGVVNITGVGATTYLGGYCSGDVTAEIEDGDGGHYLYIENQTVPGNPSDCTVILAALHIS